MASELLASAKKLRNCDDSNQDLSPTEAKLAFEHQEKCHRPQSLLTRANVEHPVNTVTPANTFGTEHNEQSKSSTCIPAHLILSSTDSHSQHQHSLPPTAPLEIPHLSEVVPRQLGQTAYH